MDKLTNSNTASDSDTIDVYTDENLWYFNTDDGEKVGPFRYKSEAQSNLNRLLQQLQSQLGIEA